MHEAVDPTKKSHKLLPTQMLQANKFSMSK